MRDLLRNPLLPKVALGLALVWLLSRAPEPVVRLGPPQTVRTVNPKMGVHTRLTDEVEPWKIKRTLELVREMGASWVVEYFPWGYYEPSKGEYDWNHPDLVVDHTLSQGLIVVARIDLVPPWARPEGTTFRYLPEEAFSDYGDFVYAFAEHFRGRVKHIIIWNEPNLSFEWGYRPPDPAGYSRLLRVAYERVKEADPNIMVLAAGLAPTLAPTGSEWGMNDLLFLESMYEAGARGSFDGLAVHAYGWTLPPADEPDATVLNYRRAELLHQVMERYGDAALPCFITEAGWNDHPRWAQAVPPGLRIAYTVDAYEMALRDWPWCEMAAMWAFRYPRPTRTFQDGFAFVTPQFIPYLIYDEVQAYARAGG